MEAKTVFDAIGEEALADGSRTSQGLASRCCLPFSFTNIHTQLQLFSHHTTMPPKQRAQISSTSSVPPIPKSITSTSQSTTHGKSSSTSSFSSKSNQSAQDVLIDLWNNYLNTTPQRVKLVDVFMAFLVMVGGLQFVYCVLVGNYVSACPLRWRNLGRE